MKIRYILGATLWVLACAFIFEPLLITPYFDLSHGVQVAFSAPTGELHNLGKVFESSSNDAVKSMDHIRVLCMLYFGLPATLYLVRHIKSL